MNTFNIKSIKPNSSFKYKKVKPKKSKFKLYGLMFFVLIIFFTILFTYVMPSVIVIVIPETQNVEKGFEVQLTTDNFRVDKNKNIFRAEIFAIEEQTESNFKATGEKDIGEKASGLAKFYNHTGRSQPLTTNLDLINDLGIIFVLKESMTIPPARVDDQGNIVAGEIEAEIEAKEPGEKYNVDASRINISALDLERQEKVYGEIINTLTGGSSKIVTVVCQEDIDNAKDELIKKLEPEIKENLQKKTGRDVWISDKLIVYETSDITHQVEVNQEVKNFDLGLKLKARAMVFDNKLLRSALQEKVSQELPKGQTIAETEFDTGSAGLEISVENFDIDSGLANLKIKTIFPVSEKIDLDEIKKNIMGKKETEARRYILSLPNVKNVRFMFSLSLTDKIPTYESKVKVRLGEEH